MSVVLAHHFQEGYLDLTGKPFLRSASLPHSFDTQRTVRASAPVYLPPRLSIDPRAKNSSGGAPLLIIHVARIVRLELHLAYICALVASRRIIRPRLTH